MRSSLKALNSTSPSEASSKLSRGLLGDFKSFLKSFKSSSPAFGAGFYISLWPFNIFRRPSLDPFCIPRLGFVDLHFFLHIPMVPIWLLSGFVGCFSALVLAFPLSSSQRYWSTDMQARWGSYVFSVSHCYTSGRHKASTNKLQNFCCKVERQSTSFQPCL